MDRRWYPAHADHWDDEIFRRRILERLQPGMDLLDLGAGAGIVQQMDFRGRAARICGLDPDVRVASNPFLHEARLGTAAAIPWGDRSFDLVFADNVLEHLPEPARAFAEIARVLKPGGWFLAKTPNRWHYMPLAARLTPHRFHRYFNRLRGRAEADTFPTRYRANTPRAIRRLAAGSGLTVERLDLIEGRPEYLRLSPLTYAIGLAYERLVNASSLLAGLRIVLIAELRRQASGPAAGAAAR
jgi:SAM-dependent methyltransferase